MKIERRVFTADQCELRNDDGVSTVKGHGAVFNRESEDLGGFIEVIAPGAFDDVLDDDVRALWNHDANHILGRTVSGTLRLSVDESGLAYEIDMPDTQLARDLAVSMERGDVTQSSFAFTVADDDWEEYPGGYKRTINKIGRLYDVSPVTYPAYPDADAGLRSLEKIKEKAKQMRTESALASNALLKAKLKLKELA